MKMQALLGVLFFMVLLLLFVASIGAVFAGLAIFVKRFFERLFLRIAEARALSNPWSTTAKVEQANPSPYFPFASVGSLLLIASLVVLYPQVFEALRGFRSSIKTLDFGAMTMVSSLAQILALPLLFAVFYFHYSGSTNRKLKYELILSFILMAWFCGTCLHVALQSWREEIQVSSSSLAISLVFWWALFLVAQPLVSRLAIGASKKQSFKTWFYRFQSPAWWFLALASAPLFITYCLIRFHFVNIVSRHPILYFRSFELKRGSQSFGGIVAKSARRYGVLEALMTERQRGSDLQAPLELADQAHFLVADQASWKTWVTDRLSVASLVIVDMTDVTGDSVAWEIQQSIHSLGPSRVAILFNGAKPSIPENVWSLNYDLSRKGIKKAKRELSNWLGKTLPGTQATVSRPVLPPPLPQRSIGT